MIVQHNMQAANTNRYFNIAVESQSKTAEKLASGYRVNRAADDAQQVLVFLRRCALRLEV